MKFLKSKLFWITLIILVLAGYFIPNIIATNAAKKQIDKIIEEYLNDYDVNYKNVSVNIYTKKAVINDISITPSFLNTDDNQPFIRINEIESKYLSINDILKNYEVKEVTDIYIPKRFYTKLHNVQIDYSLMLKKKQEKEKLKEIFKELSLNDGILSLDYTISGNFDSKAGKLNYLTDIKVKKLINLKSDFTLTNIETDKKGKIKSEDSLKNIAFEKIKFEITDNSLTDKIFKIIAKEKKIAPKKLKSFAIEGLRQGLKSEKSEYLKNLYKNLEKFIENPSTLIIKITPEKPIKFSEVFTMLVFSKSLAKNSESFLKDTLGLSIEYK